MLTRQSQAIQWAIISNVDLIFVGGDPPARVEGTDELEEAVHQAYRRDIAIIGAASEESFAGFGSLIEEMRGSIAIGVANLQGTARVRVQDRGEFLFPEFEIPVKVIDGTPPVLVSGNRTAAALACGFAGLLLYCAWLVNDPDGGVVRGSWKNIHEAFRNLRMPNRFVDARRALIPALERSDIEGFRIELRRLVERANLDKDWRKGGREE